MNGLDFLMITPLPAPEDTVAFWEDGTHTYYISRERLSQTFVTYENGEVEDLVTALENGHIDISDLDIYGVPYYIDYDIL